MLWDDVSVEAGARLDECIVADGVTIPEGSSFTRCAIVRAADRPAGPNESRVGDLLVARL
jgi:ADP-glucose pyrophosphorylase